MATRQEIQAKIAELENELEAIPEAEDYDIWVESDGVKFTLRGPEKQAFLKKHRKLWEEAVEEAEEELEEEKEEVAKVAKKTAVKKTAVKRTPKPKVEESLEETSEDELESEAHEETERPRSFFSR